jgi:hypothetical protein
MSRYQKEQLQGGKIHTAGIRIWFQVIMLVSPSLFQFVGLVSRVGTIAGRRVEDVGLGHTEVTIEGRSILPRVSLRLGLLLCVRARTTAGGLAGRRPGLV